jgi:2-phosphosulfolactate phosphatase
MPMIDAVRLPDELTGKDLSGINAVVIDVLRATSTIIAAIENGASAVLPVAGIDNARAHAQRLPGALLAGERHAKRIDGFDLGNSPLEHTQDRVDGRVIVLSTTNGTRAFELASGAFGKYAGALTNRSALSRELIKDDRDVCLVCSGTDGKVSDEDCFGAGLIIDALGDWGTLSSAARVMRDQARDQIEQLGDPERVISSSFHGRRLLDLGFDRDIAHCSVLDHSQIVPKMGKGGMLVRAC